MNSPKATSPAHLALASTRARGLDRLAASERGRVQSIGGDGETRRRLLEMGLCTGTEVQVLRRAPLGDPIELRLRGYLLSIRAEQARFVLVTSESEAA